MQGETESEREREELESERASMWDHTCVGGGRFCLSAACR